MRLQKPTKQRDWPKEINVDECLAKTEKRSGRTVAGMTVFQHCRATGLVAEALADQFPLLVESGLFPNGFTLVAALHDIGKICPSFQKRIVTVLEDLDEKKKLLEDLRLKDFPDDINPSHSDVSYASLYDETGEDIASIEGAHHGGLNSSNFHSSIAEQYGGIVWQQARMQLLEMLRDCFGSYLPIKLEVPEILFLTGLTVVSDWISSSITIDEAVSHDGIFMEKVRKAGFCRYDFRKELSFQEIFGFAMRLEQVAFDEMITDPGVYILEAGMGSGKTEAALYAAYRLLATGKASGMYFALPSRLTARQIHDRTCRFLSRVLPEESVRLKLVFAGSFLYEYVNGDRFQEPSWFDSRKRLILAPFGVGTVDQALMSVISVKHASVRAFGLAGKVVIIDEVHSYDSYTGSLIKNLVKLLVQLHATVIILSATLRREAKAELLDVPVDAISSNYPCITRKINGVVDEKAIEITTDKIVELEQCHSDEDSVDKAIEYGLDGKYVLWIENTVAEAQSIFKRVAARCSGLPVRVGLLHSRFLGPDRQQKEEEYIKAFGKDGWNSRDGSGFILVGTQILEQSIDIDSDVLFTRIAPIDMLIQRMGRLWRHEHEGRKGKPICCILSPTLSVIRNEQDVLYPSAAVYSGYVLYRTMESLQSRLSISIPRDIPALIEEVYSERMEQSPLINDMKRQLEEEREKLRNLARTAGIKAGLVLSDEVLPRYSELKTVRILILAGMENGFRFIRFLDGTCVDISNSRTPEDKARITLKLEENILSVPKQYCPNITPLGNNHILSDYIFISANEDNPLFVLICNHGRLEDISGNEIIGFGYSGKLGYSKE